MRELEGKVAVITGAGRGIGRLAAIRLAGRGARVALVSRSAGQLAETAGEIEAQGGVCDRDPGRCGVAAIGCRDQGRGREPPRSPVDPDQRGRRLRADPTGLEDRPGRLDRDDHGQRDRTLSHLSRLRGRHDRGTAGGASSTSPPPPRCTSQARSTAPTARARRP